MRRESVRVDAGMTDKEQQLKQFRAAVDRKAESADNPERRGPHPEPGGDPGDPAPPEEATRGQDVGDPREKSSRKGHVTADKWNQ